LNEYRKREASKRHRGFKAARPMAARRRREDAQRRRLLLLLLEAGLANAPSGPPPLSTSIQSVSARTHVGAARAQSVGRLPTVWQMDRLPNSRTDASHGESSMTCAVTLCWLSHMCARACS
jgi:hypothetical protein